MRLRIVYLFFIISFLISFGCTNHRIVKTSLKSKSFAKEKEEKNRYDEAMGLAQWEFEITKDPETNTVPKDKILDAIAFEKKRRDNIQYEAAISGMTWKERGPNNVGGRTRAIMVDPNDGTKKTLWAGGVDGGLWKTTDITATEPNWTPINDLFSNLAITTMAYDSTNNDTMYFGTGEGWYNLDAVTGFGVWRTVDQGANWTQLSSTTGSGFNYVNRIVVHPTNHKVYVATKNGIYLSTDAGASFSIIGYSGINVSDIELSASGRVHIGIGDYGTTRAYHYTDNDGTSWDPSAHNFNTIVNSGNRVELAIAPTNGNILYALVGTTGAIKGIYKTTDGGITWTACTGTTWNDDDCVTPYSDFTRSQSWYDLAIAVNPADANNVIIGGVDLLKSTNGGTSWTQITSWWGGCSRQYVHADQHLVYFEPGSSTVAYFGNDGGVWRTTNATAATPTITEKNTNYNVTQYYSASIHPTAYRNFLLGGAQDNGSHIIKSAGIGSGTEVTGGDGAYCHIETDQPQYQYTSYVFNNFYRSSDTGTTFTQIIADNNGSFITSWDFDNTNDILYAAYSTNNIRRYSSMHGTPSGTILSPSASAGTVTHIKVSPNTPTTIYVGTSSGNLYKMTNANGTPTSTSIRGGSFPAGSVSCVEVEKGNELHLLVTFSNYSVVSVWESTDGGTSWTNVEGNLPNLPVRWAIFSPINNDNAMLATETGVYSTDNLNGGSTNWGINSGGMPNVRVDMLKVRASDSVVLAATHGRGLFTTDVFSTAHAEFEASSVAAYINQPILFTDGSYKATSWAWDFDNNGSIDATTQNPTWAYGTSGYKTVKLTINGNLSKTVTNYIQVLPNLATPFTTAQGGNFESNASYFGSASISGSTNLWVRGTPTRNLTTLNSSSNGWKTQLGANVPAGTYQCALYTPSFNLYNAGTYSLNFRKSMEVVYCNAPFALQVQYTLDFGTTWTTLGAYADGLGTNWYNSNPSGACPMATDVFANQQGWINNYSNQATAYNISSLAGNKSVAFRFVFSVAAGYSAAGYLKDGFLIDDVTITSSTSNPANYFVETSAQSKSENFGPSETDTFYSSNGKIIAILKNNSSHDYGLTTVTIDNTGSGAINYSTNTLASKRLFQKTITVVPTTNNATGNYTASLYYDAAELSGWRGITGNAFTNANIIKCPVNIASGTIGNGVYGTSTSKAIYGSADSSITATFATGFSGFGSGVDISILPVELISFNAIKNNKNVDLEWKTASEINNSGFDIERSMDGRNWTKISFVKGHGNSAVQLNYQFTDFNVFENTSLIYYRLKQIDYNGMFKYSNIRAVKNTPIVESVILSPQPANGILHVQTSLSSGFNYHIVSAEGKILVQGSSKTNKASIDIGSIPAGTYYLKISDDQQTLTTKSFIKVD